MPSRALVLDANILVRAVLGKRVRALIETYAESVSFFVPEVAYAEAEENLPTLVARRGGDPEKALSLLRSLRSLMVPIGNDVYGEFEAEAKRRLAARDPEDWPILASALALGCPIWTAAPDESWPISYNLTEAAKRILEARSSGVAFRARRISSGMVNVI
jgi:predicted nucleic acid-binding protein